ncbi:uncharacterized protein LOC106152495 isoform X2 [Lingula anatina]|uniref:Uncharacterized protein LOC106152495 isoform X2 n=1 Tax=Lingula anatina TaxID=7574 RepID=A0A1S3H8V5_LINAN|nr:uncharacterized protein LOC106152495 isoform X2 [Lingula anatina]|eukprot:XP_013381559.1 uncharacterized protein LOC106152495 isoform X2 [Lingula anatina]
MVTGTPCTTDAECNIRATDCLGIVAPLTNLNNPNLRGRVNADLASLLTPTIGFICSFNDRVTVDTTPIYFCNPTTSQCADYNPSPPENTPIVNGTVLFYQGLVRDFLPILFTKYPNVVPDPAAPNRLTYLAQNIYEALLP